MDAPPATEPGKRWEKGGNESALCRNWNEREEPTEQSSEGKGCKSPKGH